MKRDRKVITSLKKKIRQLEKLLETYESEEAMDQEEVDLDRLERRKIKKENKAAEQSGKKPKEVPKKHTCPKCNSNMDVVDLGPYKFKWCIDKRDCNYREKL